MNKEANQLEQDARVIKLKEWIKNSNPHLGEFDLDTDLMECRAVNSLQFISFLLYLENLRGASIPGDQVQAEQFRTLRSIKETYL